MKKDAAIKAEKLKPEALQAPWGTPAEVWTANMPENALNSLSQKKAKKDMKEHSLAQAKAEDQEENESESENESEDEDSGDESDE